MACRARHGGRHARAGFLSGLAAITLAGCASLKTVPSSLVEDHGARLRVELAAVPFFAQEEHECGPAALAMILRRSGVEVTPEGLDPEVFLPARQGSLAPELVAAVRRHGRLPEMLPPRTDAVLDAVAAGRPVLVLQNLGLEWLPRMHYAVVIGYDLGRQEVFLRSGPEPRQALPVFTFEQTWQRAGGFALTALQPEQAPLFTGPERWLQTLSDARAPAVAWALAARRWPHQGAAGLGLANARLQESPGDFKGAELALREALAGAPDFLPVYNNLALVLAHQANWSEARRILDQGQERLRAVPAGEGVTALAAQFEDTRRQLQAGRLTP